MEIKIFFIAALTQVLKIPFVSTETISKVSISESDPDEFSKIMTIGPMQTYAEAGKLEILSCYEKQQKAYENFLTNFTKQVQKAAQKINPDSAGKQFPIYLNTKNAMNNMAGVMTEYPKKLAQHIKKKNFKELASCVKQTRQSMKNEHYSLETQIDNLKKQNPEKHALKLIEGNFKNIVKNFKTEGREIVKYFQACVLPLNEAK